MSQVTFRCATRADLARIVQLLADDALGQTRETFSEPLPEAYTSAFEEIARDPNSELIVGEMDGKVIATLHLTFIRYLTFTGGKRAQIEAVRVDSRLRGSGIGAQMINWAVERARQQGCHMVQLTSNKSRPDAVRFYEKLGFKATHEGMKLYLS